MEELLNQIATEIYKQSLPRPYDWIMLISMAISIAVAIAVAIFTYKIYKRQLKLMEEQKELTGKISERQDEITSKIADRQDKIALFEKRFEVYRELVFYIELSSLFKFSESPNPQQTLGQYTISTVLGVLVKESSYQFRNDNELQVCYDVVSDKERRIARSTFLFDNHIATEIISINESLYGIYFDLLSYGKLPSFDNVMKIENFKSSFIPIIENELKL